MLGGLVGLIALMAGVQGGVWVIGMIRGTPAERAGVEQGDQLLAVDGRALDGATPFQAANLLMGAVDDGPAAAPLSAVNVMVRSCQVGLFPFQ